MKSFFAVDSCWMQPRGQGWFVITRPSAETKLAEQPPPNLAEDKRTLSSQSWVGAKPYFSLTLEAGKLLYVHMPSSASAGAAPSREAMMRRRFMKFLFGRGRGARRARISGAEHAGLPNARGEL